ncbi:unnamed protein product, partial [marine sediment metagenome]
MSIRNVTFEEWKARKLQDPEYRAALEELEAGYQVARLRIMRGLTQRELAKLVGTWQPRVQGQPETQTATPIATQEADVEAIAAGIKKSSGRPDYRAIIIARADRAITDLNGKTLAYVDVGSASGYLFPSTYIAEQGIQLGEVLFAGGHGAVIQAVKNGTVDAGAIADNRYRIALEEGVIADGEFAIVWQSEPIPNSPVAVQKSMEPELKANILKALLNMPREVVEGT